MNVAKRVEDLERAIGGGTERTVVIVEFEDPHSRRSVHGYRSLDDGQTWAIREGETPESLRKRASDEVTANQWGTAVLIEVDE